jgi:hypothetical protein
MKRESSEEKEVGKMGKGASAIMYAVFSRQ